MPSDCWAGSASQRHQAKRHAPGARLSRGVGLLDRISAQATTPFSLFFFFCYFFSSFLLYFQSNFMSQVFILFYVFSRLNATKVNASMMHFLLLAKWIVHAKMNTKYT
jgi:hypothetical protein